MKVDILSLYENKINKVMRENYKEIDSHDLESFYTFQQYDLSKFSTMVVEGKTILEWFELNNISYWWFIYSLIGSRLQNACVFANNLFSCLKHYSPSTLIVKGNYDKIDLISQICKKNNIILQIPKFSFMIFKIKRAFRNSFERYAYRRITFTKHRKRLKRFYERRGGKFSIEPGCTIVTAPGVYSRIMTDAMTGNTEGREFILQPIIDLLRQNKIPLLCLDIDYTFRGNEKPLLVRLQTNLNWAPIEILLTRPKSSSLEKSILALQLSINRLKRSNLSELLTYNDIKLWEYFEPILNEIFYEPNLPTYLHLIEQLEEFLSKNRPKVIIQVYETGPYAKAFEVIAKKLGIRTIGIQHGIIYEGNPDYMHKEIFKKDNPLGNPIPDLTLVFGEHYKKVLVEKGNYPQEKIAIIGNPTFYGIEKIKQELSKESIRAKYLIPDKKIILVPLTYRVSESRNNPDKILLDILYDHFKDSKEVVVLIRLHPTDTGNSKEMLSSKFSTRNFVYSQGELVEDIFVSDVVVTPYSTVGIDSAIFDRPVIFTKLVDTAVNEFQKEVAEHGLAITCEKDDIIPKIISILNGKLQSAPDSRKKEFLESYFNLGRHVNLLKIIYG